ncbi:MAG: methionyl-tRNA formyltransferase [Dehalococcoidales bacterium]|nr:methionyl-tRNA formyltransferase [Dehalococcoidales bacterium]
MRIVFMGTPEFAVYPLEALAGSGDEVVAVYTQPDRPSGRGRAVEETPVKKAALRCNLSVLQPENLKSPETIRQLAELKPDAIVVAAFGQILRQSVLEIPPFGCINIHPSLLPRYRGVAPVPAAILNGEAFTGVSIMLLDKGIDTGPVLARAQVPVTSQDTAGLLLEKLSRIGAQLLLDVLPRWYRKEIKPQPQGDTGATYTKMLAKEAGEIDWHLPAVEIWRRIRAYQPWPGCYTKWQGKQLKIIEAIPLAGEGGAKPGEVVAVKDTPAAFGVASGDGVLGVIKVQLEGKRVMPADEFLRGQRQFIEAVLA